MKLFFTVFWRSMSAHKRVVAALIPTTIILASLWLIEPLYGRHAVDQLLQLAQGEAVNVPLIIGGWIGIYILVSVTQGIMFYIRWRVQNLILIRVREFYYERLLALDVQHHIKARGGELMKKLDNAADAMVDLTRNTLLELSPAILTAVGFYIISFTISWKLALMVLAMIPIYIILIWCSVRKTRKHFDKVNELWVRSIGRGYDAIANIFTIKSSAAEQRELKTMEKQHRDGLGYLNKANVTWAMLEGIGYFMLTRILLIAFGMLLYINGEISLGSVFFFQFGFFRMIVPMEMLSHSMPWWNEKIGKIRLAEERLTQPVLITNNEKPQRIPDFKGQITFQNVSFSYGDTDAINQVSFEIKPGEHIALVGHSGAGKSTMAMLINRFYDVTKGEILIDGINLKDLDVPWWRQQIGLVLQENIMFNDSVFDNIAYARDGAIREEVIEAAKRASADQFIGDFADGYDTLIGERGVRLSGGERQRVAIARAILKQPKLVVLDEATSALDSKTEALVQEGIKELITGRTAIIIAHRLSTVRSVDRIAVMDKGKLLAFAPHEELMDTCDVYREMVELQSHGMLAA